MIKLRSLIKEGFDNWIQNNIQDLENEYKLEYENKNLGYELFGKDIWPTSKDFISYIQQNSKVEIITPQLDSQINNRSQTTNMDDLIDLIKSYRSYPKYRNEETLNQLDKAFKTNQPIKMPIILKMPDKSLRIFSGNTRMDLAIMNNVNPKALVVDLSNIL